MLKNDDRQLGFEQSNYISNGGKSKILAPIVLIVTLFSLYFTLMFCLNIWLSRLGVLNQWVFFGPLDEIKLSATLFHSDMILKFDFLKWIATPIAFHILFAAIFYRASMAIGKASRPSGIRHGSSRFSTYKDICGASPPLLEDSLKDILSDPNKTGVVLGKVNIGTKAKPKYKFLIEKSANEHILCYAPSRSGKGVGLVIPSLLLWKDSAIVLDPKGENYEKTSGHLSSTHNCIRLDLGEAYHRLNPIGEINPRSLDMPDEVQRSIGIIMDGGAKDSKDDGNKYWENQAKNMMQTMLTYLLASFEPKKNASGKIIKDAVSLFDLALLLSGVDPIKEEKITGVLSKGKIELSNGMTYPPDAFIETTSFSPELLNELYKLGETKALTNMQATLHKVENYVHEYKHTIKDKGITYISQIGSFLKTRANGFLSTPEQTLNSIISSCTQYLNIFMLPNIRSVTSVSDFKLKDLVDPTKKPTILYLVNPPKDELTGKTDPIIKLILQNLFVSVLYETGLREAYGKYKPIVLKNFKEVIDKLTAASELREQLKSKASSDESEKAKINTKIKELYDQISIIQFHPVAFMILETCKEAEELVKYSEAVDSLIKRKYHDINVEDLRQLFSEPKFLEIAEIKYGYTKRAVLCMLDEFPKLGKFSIMEKLLADAAGYGAKFYLIAQSDQQIYSAYGKENSIFAGCQHKVMYRPADKGTAKELSEILGNYTHIEQNINVNDSGNTALDIFKPKSVSKSWSESSKPLMSLDEILQMGDDDSIIMSKRLRIYGTKIKYFNEPDLKDLTEIPQFYVQKKPLIETEELALKKLRDWGVDFDESGEVKIDNPNKISEFF